MNYDENEAYNKNDADDYDRNIVNYLTNNIYKINLLLKNFNNNDIDIIEEKDYGITYYLEPNYTQEFYKSFDSTNNAKNNANYINYSFGSFNKNDRGLEKSQLKTLFNVIKYIKNGERYVPINGGPGVGKSTIANYIISNLLFDEFYEINHNLKTILLTGKTKQSVINISETTTINPPKHQCWIKPNDKFANEINYLFYKLDINYSEISSNEELKKLNTNFNDLKFTNTYFYVSNDLYEYIKSSYIKGFIEYFNQEAFNINNIKEIILGKISYNVNIIKNFNKLIVDHRNNNLSTLFDKCVKLNNIIDDWKAIANDIKKINMVEEISKLLNNLNVNNFFPNISIKIEKILQKKSNKFLRLFWSNKKVYKKILYYINLELDNLSEKLKNYIIWTKNNINNLKTLNIECLSYIYNIDIYNSDMDDLIYALDLININFNIIQKELDKKIKLENTFLYKHYQEWEFIELLDKNNKKLLLKDLRVLKPVISANMQKINMKKISKLFGIQKFDYLIVDEASQVLVTYALFLELIANQIIALGDEKQLPPIIDEDNNSCIKQLEEYIKIDNKIKYDSFLEYVNKKTSIVSNLSNIENKYNNKKGLYLLEHFRCPEQIFNLFNESFYDNTLYFMNFNENKCIISESFGKDISCNDTAWMYLTYNFNDNYLISISNNENNEPKYHVNIKEIEIAFEFIIYNFDKIKYHIAGGQKDIDAINVANNLCLISLYADQNTIINEIINGLCNYKKSSFLNNYWYKKLYYSILNKINKTFDDNNKSYFLSVLSKIKIGTIDALQGIGCEFVIFSIINKYNKNFENDPNRINVLYSRVKKHFIQIINSNYWNIKIENNLTINTRKKIEINWEKNGYSKICIDVDKSSIKLESNNLCSNYNTIQDKINIIGFRGEKIFNSILSDYEFKKLIIKKIYKNTNQNINLNNIFTYQWLNKNNEAYQLYDFKLMDKALEYYIDVKSSAKLFSNTIFMSQNEYNFANNNKEQYLIAKINNIDNYNLNFKDKSTLIFILKNITFYTLENNEFVCYNNTQKNNLTINFRQ